MRINWIVPVRGAMRLIKALWLPFEILISIPLVPTMYFLFLLATGFQVICTKIRRLFVLADYALDDTSIDDLGYVWANVIGKTGLESNVVNSYTSIRLVNEGLLITVLDEKDLFLAAYLEHEQTTQGLARILSEIFVNQDTKHIIPKPYKL